MEKDLHTYAVTFPLTRAPLKAKRHLTSGEVAKSGRNALDSKSSYRVKPIRGFESHPLRQLNKNLGTLQKCKVPFIFVPFFEGEPF